jgi:hypothetical protein
MSKDRRQNERERKDASGFELRIVLWETVVGEAKDEQ